MKNINKNKKALIHLNVKWKVMNFKKFVLKIARVIVSMK